MNRFTQALLSVDVFDNGYVLWRELDNIHPVIEKLTDLAAHNDYFSYDCEDADDEKSYIGNKLTLVCLLATLSNEDLQELTQS